MKMNNIIKVFGIALIAIFVGSGLVAAAHDGSHGKAYDMGNGVFAELKSGSLESGVFELWGDSDSHHHVTVEIVVDCETWIVSYKVAGNSGAKIVGAEKVVEPTPTPIPQNDTPVVPQNETPVVPENETPVIPDDDTPVEPKSRNVTPVVPENETPVENETEPVDPEVPENDTPVVPVVPDNNTHGVVPHVSGDDVTVAPAVNNTVENATENTGNGADGNAIKMQVAGNEWIPLVIAILVIICAVGYRRY